MTFPIPSITEIKQALSLQEAPVFISKGGFKAVYRATTAAGVEEAVKAAFLPTAKTEEEVILRDQIVARIKREIEALGNRPSKYLVRLGSLRPETHHFKKGDFLVYSEEFLPGVSLNKWLQENYRPSFEELILLFKTLIELIRDLKQVGYLHRDIKPDNIMATQLVDRPFVLLDMGVAYKMDATELTQGLSPPGTLRYMAPELLKPDYKDNMDFRSDLYAAGLTIYVLASGTHPFAPKPEGAYETVYRILKTTPTPLSSRCPELPKEFCTIIDRCIRKRPALRYANLELVENELRRVTV